MKRFPIIAVVVVVAFFVAIVSVADACPTCKVALASHDKAAGDMASAYMYSILFMLAMPFTLLGAFCTYMYVLVRRARKYGPGSSSAGAVDLDRAEAHERETIGV